MTTLSERMRHSKGVSAARAGRILGWADEVEALEQKINTYELLVTMQEAREAKSELSPKDKLMQAYEKAGLANALYVQERYGKGSRG